MNSKIEPGSSPIDANFAMKLAAGKKGEFFVGDEWFEPVFPEAEHQGIQIARLFVNSYPAWLPSEDGDGWLFGMPITAELKNMGWFFPPKRMPGFIPASGCHKPPYPVPLPAGYEPAGLKPKPEHEDTRAAEILAALDRCSAEIAKHRLEIKRILGSSWPARR